MIITRHILYTDSDIAYAREFLLGCFLIANDIETIPFRKKTAHMPFVMTINCYTGIHVDGRVESFCVPFQRGKFAASGAPENIRALYDLCAEVNLSGIPFTGHNYIYDLIWLMRYDLPVANWAYDSMTMFWSKWPELPKTLDFVSSILLDHYQYWKAGRKSDDFIEYCNYGMSDTESTLFNTIALVKMMLKDSKMAKNFASAHLRCIVGLSMSAKGMRTNPETMEELSVELQAAADEALERLRYLVADPEFNPNSPKQKVDLLYGLLGASKRNAKGRFVKDINKASAGKMPLRAMRNEHPLFKRVVDGILNAIEPAKQISNVVGLSLLEKPGNSPRFYTTYSGVGTTTTRFASSTSALGLGGNAQNIRKKYRRFCVADKDSFLLEIDYSAADDVHVSFESQEQLKIDLVRSGKDIHAVNALIFFSNWTYDRIVEGKKAHDDAVVHPITGIRQITKKLVHGIHYLMAALTLLMSAGREAIVAAAKEIGYDDANTWNQEELTRFCETLEQKFRAHYPRFARSGPESWYSDLREEAKATGGFTTIYGYFQRFLGESTDDNVLRAIAATAGQANTAGRINIALEELVLGTRCRTFRDGRAPDSGEESLQTNERDFGISLRLQTHDSATFNIRHTHPKWEEGVERIFHVMNRPVICKGETFRIATEAEVSFAWAGPESTEIKSVEDIKKFLNANL